LVSITKRLFLIQKLLKNFFCMTVFSRFFPGYIQQIFKPRFFFTLGNSIDLFTKAFFKIAFYFRRYISPSFGRSLIYLNNYAFHFLFLLIYSESTKVIKNNIRKQLIQNKKSRVVVPLGQYNHL
jgi:hypothetical protein